VEPNLINGLASAWWSWMWPVTWQVSILAALVLGLDVALRKWAWPQLLYGLWLLVPAKLLLPPGLASPMSLVGRLVGIGSEAAVTDAALSESTVASAGAMGAAASVATPDWRLGLMVLWLAASAFVVIRTVRGFAVARRSCSDSRAAVPDWVSELFTCTASKMHLRRPPALVVTDRISSPAVIGVFRPTVLLPVRDVENLSRQALSNVMLHELAHIRRGDLAVHAISTVLLVFHWFNPFLWLAQRRSRELREMACDATVVGILSGQAPGYRRTLAEAADRLADTRDRVALGFMGLMEETNMLATRLEWAGKDTWSNRRTRYAATLAAMVAMAVFVLPMCEKAGEPVASKPAGSVESLASPTPPDTSGAMEFWMVTVRPKPLSRPAPVYPEEARQMGIEGDVLVSMVVGADGRVKSATALRGHEMLTGAAVDAVKRMRFSPGEQEGVRVPVKVTQRITFRAE